MTNQPELPDFFRDLQIQESLNRIADSVADRTLNADLQDGNEMPEGNR